MALMSRPPQQQQSPPRKRPKTDRELYDNLTIDTLLRRCVMPSDNSLTLADLTDSTKLSTMEPNTHGVMMTFETLSVVVSCLRTICDHSNQPEISSLMAHEARTHHVHGPSRQTLAACIYGDDFESETDDDDDDENDLASHTSVVEAESTDRGANILNDAAVEDRQPMGARPATYEDVPQGPSCFQTKAQPAAGDAIDATIRGRSNTHSDNTPGTAEVPPARSSQAAQVEPPGMDVDTRGLATEAFIAYRQAYLEYVKDQRHQTTQSGSDMTKNVEIARSLILSLVGDQCLEYLHRSFKQLRDLPGNTTAVGGSTTFNLIDAIDRVASPHTKLAADLLYEVNNATRFSTRHKLEENASLSEFAEAYHNAMEEVKKDNTLANAMYRQMYGTNFKRTKGVGNNTAATLWFTIIHHGRSGLDVNDLEAMKIAREKFRNFLGRANRCAMLKDMLGKGALYTVAASGQDWGRVTKYVRQPCMMDALETLRTAHPELMRFFDLVRRHTEALLKGVELPEKNLIESGAYKQHPDLSFAELIETSDGSGPHTEKDESEVRLETEMDGGGGE